MKDLRKESKIIEQIEKPKPKYELFSPCVRRAVCELSEGGNGEQRRQRSCGNDLCIMHEGLADFLKLRSNILKASV